MYKSKRQWSKNAIEPSPSPSNSRHSNPNSTMPRKSSPQRSNKSQKSFSSTDPSSSLRNYNFITSTGSSYYSKCFWVTTSNSSSGNPQPSRLRDNLLEQPHVYDISEISAATNNFLLKPFSSSSSSTSWRCSIRRQNVVLIQRKFRRPMNVSELVDRLGLICKSHHSSLVKLKGASISGNYIYLVYEYIQGGNLAECLRNPRNPHFTVLSDWLSRVKIAADIAHGLDYIHHSTGLGCNFVHNHIKSTSIIITLTLNAKICHFGTAKLCGEITMDMEEEEEEEDKDKGKEKEKVGSKSRTKMEYKRSGSGAMRLEGTRGYMAPEFQETGVASEKTDVYAFGVVILELLSGQEPLKYCYDEGWGGYVRESVIEAAKEAVEEGGGGVRRWVDKRLKDSYPVEVVEKLARLGIECVADDPDKRPDMGSVVVRISQYYLESQTWVQKMGGLPTDFSVSLAPR